MTSPVSAKQHPVFGSYLSACRKIGTTLPKGAVLTMHDPEPAGRQAVRDERNKNIRNRTLREVSQTELQLVIDKAGLSKIPSIADIETGLAGPLPSETFGLIAEFLDAATVNELQNAAAGEAALALPFALCGSLKHKKRFFEILKDVGVYAEWAQNAEPEAPKTEKTPHREPARVAPSEKPPAH